MASWSLTCKRCGRAFTYSQISDTLADYFFPAKPAIASEGEECECPNCTAKFVYQRNELTYQPLKSPRD
jgi:DNA-directed RNA polymerase subunit RPC12/RpoP